MNKSVPKTTLNTHQEDRRQSVRYPITGAVEFQWQAKDGPWHDAIGTTCEIGKGGMFIESASIPPVASVVKLIVTLPAQSTSHASLQLSGVGFVRNLRQQAGQVLGFGASAVFHAELPDAPCGATGKAMTGQAV